MVETQEKLLKILSDVLWQKTPEHTYSSQEWETILPVAEDQGVLYLVLQGCTSIRQQFSAASWLKWRSKLISTMLNNETLMAAQSRIIGEMQAEIIPCAVLKGASLAVCYANPSARALGDIDLLVPRQFVEQASDILVSQGYHAPQESFAHPYHIDFYKNGIVVELHYAVSTFPDSPAGAEAKRHMHAWQEQLRQKHIGNHTFPCLSDSHQALSLLLHMERHMTTGCIGLRQLCDWAVFLASVTPVFFADQLLPELQACGLAKFAGVLTQTAVCYLSLDPAYGMALENIRKRDVQAMMEEILRAGSIHNKNNTEESSSFFVDESGTKSSMRVFISKINSLARRKFPITKQLPFLLPIFWLYIPMRYWLRSLVGKRRRKSLLRTIAVTKRRKRLYRALKLFESAQEK